MEYNRFAINSREAAAVWHGLDEERKADYKSIYKAAFAKRQRRLRGEDPTPWPSYAPEPEEEPEEEEETDVLNQQALPTSYRKTARVRVRKKYSFLQIFLHLL